MKRFGSLLIISLIAFFAYLGYDYLTFRDKNAVSDAAFVKSDSLMIVSFKVDGKIEKMTKKEGQV